MKLVVVAERNAPGTSAVYNKIASHMVRYHGGTVAVRGPRGGGPTSLIEQQSIEMAMICGADVAIFVPAHASDARAATYKRDYELVTGADLVLAFFSEGSDMGGGTGHVAKAAIDREVAIEAFLVSDDGIENVISDAGWLEGEEILSDPRGA